MTLALSLSGIPWRRCAVVDGGVCATWGDYRIYFGVGDNRTAKKRLARVTGVPVKDLGATPPIMRRAVLDKIIDKNKAYPAK